MDEQLHLIQPAEYLFVVPPRTPLCEFLEEARKLLVHFPQILDAIRVDLDKHALEKKRIRVADKIWDHQSAGTLLDCPEDQPLPDVSDLQLMKGRPRMDPRVVYLFMMVRGFAGGVKGLDAKNLFLESISVELILREFGIKRPGLSTIIDNTNAVSQETRDLILDCQLKMFLEEEKDDGSQQLVDSTAIHAHSAWPTDSSLILGFVSRIWKRGQTLEKFGLQNFDCQEIPEILKDLKKLDFQIANSNHRKNAKAKRKALYETFIDLAEIASQDLSEALHKLKPKVKKARLKPSFKLKLERLCHWIEKDLQDLDKLIAACISRIFEDKPPSSGDRPLSLSDSDAAFIQKGGREPTLGYRVQLARTRSGFVSNYLVPQGNAADAPQLLPLCQGAIERMGVVPEMISADGGYACHSTRQSLLKMGVEKVSISSSKGKAITDPGEWESEAYRAARNGRSAVESIVYQVKKIVRLGHMARRGIENVRAEIAEKILAFNFLRSCRLNT